MDIDVFWHAPVPLREATASEHLIYACDDWDKIPDAPGVYVFGRRFGETVDPIYIGRANVLCTRVTQHIEGNVRLMQAIKQRPNGARVLLVGEWLPKKGQQRERVLPILEAALIKHALSEGHELVNDKGTRTPVHTISMTGSRVATTRLFRTEMKSERKK